MTLQILYLAQGGGAGKITQTDGSLITLGLGNVIPDLPSLVGLTYPRSRRPQWSNNRHVALSGARSVNQLWFIPLYQWTITYSMLRVLASHPEWQTFADFFNSLAAGAQPFYYTDPLDNTAVDQVFGVGDGTTTKFQLCRRLVPGGLPEAIQSPVAPIIVKDNGTPTTAFTLGNAGVVTLTSPPVTSHVLTWTGSYKWLVRFDDDFADLSQMDSILFELKKISFSGEKL